MIKFLSLFFFIITTSCTSIPNKNAVVVQGKVFGSTYEVKYHGPLSQKVFIQDLEIFFKEFNREFSTYDPKSVISTLNQLNADQKLKVSVRFISMLKLAKELSVSTNGNFDPTISPLIKVWGFGPSGKKQVPSKKEIKAAVELVGFQNIKWDEENLEVWKLKSGSSLDLNAFAPGWAADLIGEYFATKNVSNYLINISGEILAKGTKPDGTKWIIGIETPTLQSSEVPQEIISLNNEAISTSGNYRQFFKANGKSFSHIFDPKLKRPIHGNICSATIIGTSAAETDAWGTAMMVLGVKGIPFAESKGLKVLLISCDSPGVFRTIQGNNIKAYLLDQKSR